jgi:hypothetical protein
MTTETLKTETANGTKPVLAAGLEELLNFLNTHGVKAELVDFDKYGFSRTIAFNVYGIDYRIEWYVNQSTLEVGTHRRSAKLPFKYVYFDNTYPLVGGNKSIGFAYEKFERKSMFDRLYPFEVFRIPIEIAE